jgi:hypothetical protein
VTKQQFKEGMTGQGYSAWEDVELYSLLEDLENAGFVLVDKQTLCEKLDEIIQSIGKYLHLGEDREHPNKTFLRTEDLLKQLKIELLEENKP